MKLKSYTANNKDANYLSIGCKKDKNHIENQNSCKYGGMYRIDPYELYNYILHNENAKHSCFVERRTEYFMLFFDLDVADQLIIDNKFDVIKLFEFIIDKIIGAISFYIRVGNSKKEIKYIYSDRNDKNNKLHLYFPNIILNSYQAMAIRNKLLSDILKDNIFNLSKEQYETIIDDSVYKQSGLRLLFQVKPHEKGYYGINFEKSTFKKLPSNRYDQLVVTSIRRTETNINVNLINNDDQCALLFIDAENIINNVKNPIKQKKQNENKIKSDIDYNLPTCLKLDIPIEFVKDLINNLSVNRCTKWSTWIKIIFMCRNYGLSELAHEASKKCPSKYDKHEVDKILYNQKCVSPKPITIGSLFEWSKEDNPIEHKNIICKYMTNGFYKELFYEQSNEFSNRKYCETYSEKFVKPLEYDKYSTIVLKSPLGSNKSGENIKAIVELVNKYNYQNISCLASRVVLVSDLFDRFNESLYGETENRPKSLNMQNYSTINDKSKLYIRDRLIQTPDSLIHMMDCEGVIKQNDVLFADEIESIFEYICLSDTLKGKRKLIFTIFMEYIRKAKHLLLADGNVSKFIVNFIKKNRPDDFKLIYNNEKNDNNKYFIMKNEHEWSDQLEAHLKTGKNIFIATDSKDFSDRMYKQITSKYPNSKIRLYNVDTDDEFKLKLGNVNDTWTKLNVVIVSPTILYGVNLSAVHFDYVYGYYQTTISARSVYQQLRRIRYVKTNEVYLHVKNNFTKEIKYYPTDLNELRTYVIKNRKEFKQVISSLNHVCDGSIKLDTNDDFTKLYLHFLSERHKCNNNYIGELTKYLTEYGGRVFMQVKNKKSSSDYKDKQNELKDIIDKEHIVSFMEAFKDISKYEEVRFKALKTSHDKNIIQVNYIMETFGLDAINEKFLEKLGKITNVEKFYRSLIYFANDDYKKKYIDKYKNGEFSDSIADTFKMTDLIKKFIKLYWKDGLLDDKQIKVFSEKNNMTIEQIEFFNDNETNMRILFYSLKRKAKPKNQFQLLGWLNCALDDFFGGFIQIDISNRQQIKKKIISNNFYICNISFDIYLELLLNKYWCIIDKQIYSNLKIIYKNKVCVFSDLHGKLIFNNLFRCSEPVYLF